LCGQTASVGEYMFTFAITKSPIYVGII
jgi:hypothetical protein